MSGLVAPSHAALPESTTRTHPPHHRCRVQSCTSVPSESAPPESAPSKSVSPRIDYEDNCCDLLLQPRCGVASRVRLRYRLVGPAGAPVVVVQGGISAHRAACHVAGIDRPNSPGADAPWWPGLVGERRAVDTRCLRVLCVEWITPADFAAPAGSQTSWRPPTSIDTTDQADALAALLRQLGIRQITAFIGSSYGGMVGLAFAARHRPLVAQLIAISAAHRSDPYATALRLVQRRIVKLGRHNGAAGQALALARQLAMTTFRTPEEFAERFVDTPRHRNGELGCEVGDYLAAAGRKFVARCDTERFLALSESIDMHLVDPTRITTPTTLVAVRSDRLIRLEQLRELAGQLGGVTQLHEIDSIYGHDAFLKEDRRIGQILTSTLSI